MCFLTWWYLPFCPRTMGDRYLLNLLVDVVHFLDLVLGEYAINSSGGFHLRKLESRVFKKLLDRFGVVRGLVG